MESCAICLDDFEGSETKSECTLKCGHKFHSKCLCLWLLNLNATCPICRSTSMNCDHCPTEREYDNIQQIISHDKETASVIIKFLIKENTKLKKTITESEDRELARNLQLRNTFETVDNIIRGDIIMYPSTLFL